MIKLERGPIPACLTPEFVNEQTEKFRTDRKSRVWDVDEIKRSMLDYSYGKCAYCEISISEESKYMEVEHFYYKEGYPDRVLDWMNLLPSCKRCNVRKGSWDVGIEGQMVVEPTQTPPSIHLRLKEDYFFEAKSAVGIVSIREIQLNDLDRLGVKRYQVGQALKIKLAELRQDIEAWTTWGTVARRNFVRRFKETVENCLPERSYSAVSATVMARSQDYASIRQLLSDYHHWDGELVALDTAVAAAALV